MFTLIITRQATNLLKDAYDWYNEQLPGLGDRFLAEIYRCYDLLEKQANTYRKVRKNFRQIICRTFPYVIIFEVVDDTVVIYSIFHTSRNPTKKYNR